MTGVEVTVLVLIGVFVGWVAAGINCHHKAMVSESRESDLARRLLVSERALEEARRIRSRPESWPWPQGVETRTDEPN